MKRAFVFPGQGSQAPGMGRDLAEAFSAARLLFEEVDDALSQHLSRLMFEGPEDELTLTENAQPALLSASLAVIRVLESEAGFDISSLAYVAGHSLGEYSALAAAGAFSAADAARLVKRRGQAMQQAVPVGEGAMAALLGLDIDIAREVAIEASGRQVCAVVNFPPRQIGPFISEVLTLGMPDEDGAVVLVRPDFKVPNGGKLF